MALSLATLGPSRPAAAAPPADDVRPEPTCEAGPRDDVQTTGRYLATRAYTLFEARDYVAAVKIWEQALALLPELEGELRMLIAFAHREAFAIDGDVQHLRAAQQLFRAQLAGLEQDSVERADVVAALGDVDGALEALAAAERAAQERRDEAIRAEARATLEAHYREERRLQQAKVQRTTLAVGGSLAGLGVGAFAAMTAFLVQGARLDRQGWTMAMSTGVEDGAYASLLARGQAQNRAAIATGVTGGVLLALGGSLLAVAARRAKKERLALQPIVGGVQVRF